MQGAELEDSVFETLRHVIAIDLCNNYHREPTNDTKTKEKLTPEHDFAHQDFVGFRRIFTGIQRRANGGEIREANDTNRAKVLAEFMRVN